MKLCLLNRWLILSRLVECSVWWLLASQFSLQSIPPAFSMLRCTWLQHHQITTGLLVYLGGVVALHFIHC
jgi:hypothetical protein